MGRPRARAPQIHHVTNIGMQAGPAPVNLKPKAIVIMGALSIPSVPIDAEQVKVMIDRHSNAAVIGVCFMHMFEKAGWFPTITFDCLIDATIDPPEVIKTPDAGLNLIAGQVALVTDTKCYPPARIR